MANYYMYARTNYFRVKDEDAFQALIDSVNGEVIRDSENRVGAIFDEAWSVYDDDDNEIDFLEEIPSHLLDDEVCIAMEIGHEKMRYLTGFAFAINNRGDLERISLGDIVKLGENLGKNVTDPTY